MGSLAASLAALLLLTQPSPQVLTSGSSLTGSPIPRADLFPGAANPAITPANMNQNICRKGWSTSSIRPPSSYTTALKKTQMHSLNYTRANPLRQMKTKDGKTTRPDLTRCIDRSANASCYEEDHLISLEIGGDPRSPDNLWPEPWFGNWNAHMKDVLENKLHRMVCDGQIPLRAAQKAIASDWVGEYRKVVAGP
jgi:hypothetical protein